MTEPEYVFPLEIFKVLQVDYAKMEQAKVSVVLTTFRERPKFDILFECLSKQTMKNFEFVISDWLYEQHKDYVQELSKKYGIPTVHVPRDSRGASHAVNIGIMHSSGDYMVHIDDCSYMPYNWIEKHLIVMTHGFLSLGARYFIYELNFPIEKYLLGKIKIPPVQDSKIAQLIQQKSNGIEKYLEIEFGEHTVYSPQDLRLMNLPEQLILENNIFLTASPGWSYGSNFAGPTEMFLELNGWDEEYDKGYGWPDCDFGVRCFNKGYKAFINPSNWVVQIVDKDHVSAFEFTPEINSKEASEHNWKLYERACKQKITRVNPQLDLRKRRKEILNGNKH